MLFCSRLLFPFFLLLLLFNGGCQTTAEYITATLRTGLWGRTVYKTKLKLFFDNSRAMQNLKYSPACTQHLLNSTLISCSYPIPRNCKRTDRSAPFPLPSIDVSALFLSGSVLDSFCLPCESIMAASASSRELFTEGVRAVLSTWPVLQVNTATTGRTELRLTRDKRPKLAG